MSEVTPGILGRDGVKGLTNGIQKRINRLGAQPTQNAFDFRKGIFNGREIGRIGG